MTSEELRDLQISTPDDPDVLRTRAAQLSADALRAWAAGRRSCCNSPVDGGHAWGCSG